MAGGKESNSQKPPYFADSNQKIKVCLNQDSAVGGQQLATTEKLLSESPRVQ